MAKKTEVKIHEHAPVFEKQGELFEAVEPTAEVKALQKAIFNLKFDYDALLTFTQHLLTHEQLIKFAAKKKEIFG